MTTSLSCHHLFRINACVHRIRL